MTTPGTTTTMPLRMAAYQALRSKGTNVLRTPRVFLGMVLDKMDPESQVARLLEFNCDEEFLGFYVEAAQERSSGAIERAARQATYLLEDDRSLKANIAEQVACELAFALASVQRVECPEHVRVVATQDMRPAEATTTDGAGRTGVVGTTGGTGSARPQGQSGGKAQGTGQSGGKAQGTGQSGGQRQVAGQSGGQRQGTGQSGPSTPNGPGSNYQWGMPNNQAKAPSGGVGAAAQNKVTPAPTGGSQAGTAGTPSSAAVSPATTGVGQKPQTKDTGKVDTSTTASTSSALSDVPSERLKQIKAQGVGMTWYSLLKVGCWLTAFYLLSDVFQAYPTISTQMSGNIQTLFLGMLVVEVVLAITYIVAWSRLRQFRAKGPKTLVTALFCTAILPFALAFGINALGFKAGIQDILDETQITQAASGIVMCLVANSYFNKRKQFFTT